MFSKAGSRLEVLNEIIYFEAFVLLGEMRMMCASVFWGGSQGLGSFSTAAYKLPKAFLLLCYRRRIGGRLNKLGFEISDTCKKTPRRVKRTQFCKMLSPSSVVFTEFPGHKALTVIGVYYRQKP